ncbi:MAG: hypothetical protein QOJ88_933 [Pyrinomonadaceae bacterium]|jgi:hypothetical protein|nr:hypothetical protein [Pyrinomonadaceae bacterium]
MKKTERSQQQKGERGAALITVLLLSTLLLAAGGTLLLTTSITGTNAVDSTSELQAYYAAEAGIARVINVLRGNSQSNPAGTRATFRNVVSTPTLWNSTSGNTITVSNASSASFRVTSIVDPDDVNGAIRAANPNYKPSRLQIHVTGFGSKNSRKNMEVIVNRFALNYNVSAVITLPNQSGTPLNLNLGSSNVTSYSGVDAFGNPLPTLPAFAVSDSDYAGANNVIDGCAADGTGCSGNGPNVSPADPARLDPSNTVDFLQSVSAARSFLYGPEGMMAAAVNEGRYFTTGDAAINSSGGLGASNPDGMLTFVDGDLTLGPGSPTGQGTLIVTGTLTLDGSFGFNGVIMVLGGGTVLRSGGGHGDIFGAMFVSKFARTGANTDLFQSPTFDTSGGGTANIQYNSDAVEKAKQSGGHRIVAVREY